jgi:hypothetical protein
MSIPPRPAPHFILLEPHLTRRGFDAAFHGPTGPRHPHDLGQRGLRPRKARLIAQASAAAGSGSAADAGGSQLQALVGRRWGWVLRLAVVTTVVPNAAALRATPAVLAVRPPVAGGVVPIPPRDHDSVSVNGVPQSRPVSASGRPPVVDGSTATASA